MAVSFRRPSWFAVCCRGTGSATGVPVVFTETRYFPLTEILPLMTRHEHLYIETSRLTGQWDRPLRFSGRERSADVWVRRLPLSGRIAWRMLEESEISDADREAIGATGCNPRAESRWAPFRST
ncbi:MAG: hypothetical protein R2839_02575 [Thermomicrobiales bacterium]